MFDNLLIIARCDVWCVGLGRLVVERWKEGRGGEGRGGEGRGEQGAMGMRWQSQLINPRVHGCMRREGYSSCLVCMYVCLSEHAILAVRAIRSITKDAILLSVRFAAILKRRFS